MREQRDYMHVRNKQADCATPWSMALQANVLRQAEWRRTIRCGTRLSNVVAVLRHNKWRRTYLCPTVLDSAAKKG
jgi:hypothetical protein